MKEKKVYCKMVNDKIKDYSENIKKAKKMNDDVLLAMEIVPKDGYVYLGFDINMYFTAKSIDDVKAVLKKFAQNGVLLDRFCKSDDNPEWYLKTPNKSTICIRPSWCDSDVEGATCRLVQVGTEVTEYPKYKLVCDGKSVEEAVNE
jgi:hypothetical protein